jgi:DNA modification methylase
MKPYYADDSVTLHAGDCLDVLRSLPDASVDAVVTDPPYGLEFMGQEWDAPWKTDARAASATVVEPDEIGGFQDGSGGNPFSRSRVRTNTLRHGGDVQLANHGFQQWCELWATECLRVLKPGGHMLTFGGTRTWHRLACAVEDAGFEIRDSIAWLYGSGFPKSLDVSKAIDKGTGENRARQLECTAWMRSTGISAAQINAATSSFMGSHYLTDRAQAAIPTADMFDLLRPLLPDVPERIERLVAERTGIAWTDYVNRPVLRQVKRTGKESGTYGAFAGDNIETAAATDISSRWQGWGTALKPAFEPIVVARKPLAGTVAANVLAHGTGALNIDGCRIEHASEADRAESVNKNRHAQFGTTPGQNNVYGDYSTTEVKDYDGSKGRWPANVVLDGSQAAELDTQSGESQARIGKPRGAEHGDGWGMTATGAEYDDQGGASRFFYVAKADASERVRVNGTAHPTVKPLALMRWLVRLVTPPGGLVLEPFAGSGTTVEACILEGFQCVAIEREADYLPLIVQRINRRRDPVAAVKAAADDGGLFDLLGEESA